MAGIVQGALAGSLACLTLTYFTQQRLQATQLVLHESLTASVATLETRNDPVVPVSNIRAYTTQEWQQGARDIWNEEVIRSVNWFYGLNLGNAAVGLIESTITSISKHL